MLSLELAGNAHKVVARYNEDADVHVIDEKATEARRAEEREARKRRAVPASEWWAKERERVQRKDVAPLVQQMYAGSFAMSERWKCEYVEFWNLNPDFTW